MGTHPNPATSPAALSARVIVDYSDGRVVEHCFDAPVVEVVSKANPDTPDAEPTLYVATITSTSATVAMLRDVTRPAGEVAS